MDRLMRTASSWLVRWRKVFGRAEAERSDAKPREERTWNASRGQFA